MEEFELFLREKGFKDLTRNKEIDGIIVPLLAHRTGKSFGILKYHDFIFVHDGSSFYNSVSEVTKVHDAARRYVDGIFKLPKSMRLTVPNIITVVIQASPFSQELINLAEKSTRTMVGGEFHAIYLINTTDKIVHGQGLSHTAVFTLPVIWVEFKNVDPQNRGHYLITGFADRLFN